MLSFADELKDRVVRLLDDVEALHLVAAVGFLADDPELYAQNRSELARGPWRYLELTDDEAAARGLLEEGWNEPRLVILSPDKRPRALLELVRAFVDRRDQVDLGDFVKRTRSRAQSLVLLVNGAPQSERIPPELRHVPCWEFVA